MMGQSMVDLVDGKWRIGIRGIPGWFTIQISRDSKSEPKAKIEERFCGEEISQRNALSTRIRKIKFVVLLSIHRTMQ